MYGDRRDSYISSNLPTCPSNSDSVHSSFGSVSSWDSSLLSTPPCTRRPSFDSVKREDSFNTPTPSGTGTPERYGSANSFCAMSAMTQEMLSGLQDPSMMFGKSISDQNMMNFNFHGYAEPMYDSFDTHHGITIEPSLDAVVMSSPTSGMTSSPVSVDFVVPSQTTFLDSYDIHSPMRPVRSLQFDSPTSDYVTEYSSFGDSPGGGGGSVKYFLSPYNNEQHHKSSSTTPSRPSALRQPMLEPLETSTVLHRIQGGQTQTAATMHSRKRAKREYILPNNISVQKQAKRPCPWEGCSGRFQRQEHLKRHMKTHTNSETHPCKFCMKIFGRSDNLKSHIKLHADPDKKSSRTQYFPEARRVYEEMSRKPRKGGESEGSSSNNSSVKQGQQQTTPRSSRVLGY